MTNRPVIARDVYDKYVKHDSEVAWPDDDRERVLLARALFGKELIGHFDYWVDHAIDFIDNPVPVPSSRRTEGHEKRAYYADKFAELSPEQKQAVKHLVREMTHAVLFSMLVQLDQGS